METAAVNLAALGVDPDRSPVVTRDQVKYAKPNPDLFLAAAERLGAPVETAVVVGDSIWDMLAAIRCALGVGLLSGGCQGLRGDGWGALIVELIFRGSWSRLWTT
jgi:phosphoglycolate phosphatase-like HAD superfamily hydrolase